MVPTPEQPADTIDCADQNKMFTAHVSAENDSVSDKDQILGDETDPKIIALKAHLTDSKFVQKRVKHIASILR